LGFARVVRYYRFSPALQPYFSAIYAFDIESAAGPVVQGYLHPELTPMPFIVGPAPNAHVAQCELAPQWPFVASGPTSRALHFRLTSSTIWGLGLQPAGWARYAAGSARELTDRTVNGSAHPSLALFRPIETFVRDTAGGADAAA